MLNTLSCQHQKGFNLIELMIGITIMAILASIAVPSFRTMMANTQIRNAAESIANGLQKARAEAVARNTNVTFVLGVNSSWTVNVVNTAALVESRSSNDGSKDVTLTVVPVGASTITFNNFGGVVANADASATLTQINFTATTASKNLQVSVGAGGNARMCDPSLSYTSNPRGC